MNIKKMLFTAAIALFLAACSGSETYRGNWKATDQNGTHLEIVFGENDFSITNQGEIQKFEYSQNSMSTSNFVETYGIRLSDGRSFQIHFPVADDETVGAILDANGQPQYIISRDNYIGYQDLYGL